LAVYADPRGALNLPVVLLGCNDDTLGLQSVVAFPAVSDMHYYIQVGGFGGQTGTILKVNVHL
jgi:hypothetical protein